MTLTELKDIITEPAQEYKHYVMECIKEMIIAAVDHGIHLGYTGDPGSAQDYLNSIK